MQADGAPPPAALIQRLTGTWVAQAISVVAALGVADALADGPRDVEALAAAATPSAATTEIACATHVPVSRWISAAGGGAPSADARAPSLYRLLRALASVGIFAEGDDGRFRLTPLAEPLRGDDPDSVRAQAIMLGEAWAWRPFEHLLESVRTGRSAFERAHGLPIFEYLARHPEASAAFDAGMTPQLGDGAVAADYDFSRFGTVVDVGGGRGSFLAAILRAHPAVRGVLFEQAHVVPGARQYLDAAGLSSRCEVVAGDIFAAVAAGGDAYVLKRVIHDWDDDRAVRILERCRRAMPPTGRLLVVETVIPPGNAPSFGKLLDVLILAWTGGKARTEAEHRRLLEAAGFAVTRVVPTRSALSVVEAAPREPAPGPGG
jgi:hypothetical protein